MFVTSSNTTRQNPGKKPGGFGGLRYQTVLNLTTRCGYPEGHSHQVARLAGQIFQETRDPHGLGDIEARLLRYAALLRDIRYQISYAMHHKHGSYLVVNCELNGFTPEEREILVQQVRDQRGAKPKPSHEPFAGSS